MPLGDDEDTPYPIMSTRADNSLEFFSHSHGSEADFGRLMFNVRVVQADVSFCALQTGFAVDVFGEPLSNGVIVLTMTLTVVGIALLLLGSYFSYRRKKVNAWRKLNTRQHKTD